MSGADEVSVSAHSLLGESGGTDPDRAVTLAKLIVEKTRSVPGPLTLSFQGVGAVSSGFANAFFLTLASARPLDEWSRVLNFVDLGALQSRVMRASLRAARTQQSSSS